MNDTEVKSFDETFETVRIEIIDFLKNDPGMEKKVLDELRNGDFD